MNPEKNIYLKIAGFLIRIRLHETEDIFLQEKLYKDINIYYKGFIVSQKKNLSHYNINFIKKKKYPVIMQNGSMYINFFSNDKKRNITCLYDVGIMHFQLLLREVLQNLLSKYGGFMLHASANNMNGEAIFFPAKQGSGKSTVMSLLHDKYPALADDTVIIRKENGKFFLYQTPFVETNHWVQKEHKKYPIGAIFFLRKSHRYAITKVIDHMYIVDRLAKQIRLYEEYRVAHMKQLLEFLKTIDCYTLFFGKDKERLLELFRKK